MLGRDSDLAASQNLKHRGSDTLCLHGSDTLCLHKLYMVSMRITFPVMAQVGPPEAIWHL